MDNTEIENQIDMEMITQEWATARTTRESYTNDFASLDNIVDGIPVSHQSNAPFVGDTTLAGLVRSVPRNSLEQLPIFSATVNGTKNSIPAQICSYLLRKAVFNEDTFGKGLLSTMQVGAEEALTHGYAPFMVSPKQMGGDYGTSMKGLHYADVDPESGITDAYEAGFFYVVANLPKSRVRKIYEAAILNPDTSWKTDKLKELLDMQPDGKNYSIYQSSARNKNAAAANTNTYQFVTRYETGKNGKFVTFCPQIQDAPLRVIENKSKYGYPRVLFLVIDPASLSPYGTSRVRLASPMQNMMNVYLQNIASMLLLNSAPPVLQRGRFTAPIQLKQNAKWITLDQNAKAELIQLDNGALAQFVPFAQQFSSQIQNMMGTPSGALNGNSNAFGYSKTGPGVRMQEKATDVATNQVTNIMENFLRQYALVALDTYICEQEGEDELIVDDDCKNAINRFSEANFVPQPDLEVDPTGQTMTTYKPVIGDDNKITINWDELYEGIKDWTVEIELSVGKDEMEEKKRADIQDMHTVMAQTADPADPVKQAKIGELEDIMLEKAVPEYKAPEQPATPVTQPMAPMA